jgi:hypothetical protein
MSKVQKLIPLGHCGGDAVCLTCHHEWHAVSKTGTIWLDCPSCKTAKGRYKFGHQREGAHWACNCGNDLFYIMPECIYCPNCGISVAKDDL